MSISLKADAGGTSGAIQVNGVDAFAFGNGAQFSFRNKIINGAFAINQRAYVSGAATAAGQYTLDRWKVSGTGGITFSTVNNKTTVTIPTGQTLQQVIEGLNLATGTYVLSWEGTAQGRIAGGSYGASGAVTASITGGANTTIEFNSGTVANVQLEAGSIATPFEHRPIGTELALCQRYYQQHFFGAGRFDAATLVQIYGRFAVPMRASPTLGTPSGSVDEIGIAARTITSASSSALNEFGGRIGFVTSGATMGAVAASTISTIVPINSEL